MSIKKPNYRQKQDDAQRERNEATERSNIEKIICALKAIVQKFDAANDENTPQKRTDRIWERVGIVGLWLAAVAGLTAIYISRQDSHRQQVIMQGQLAEMQLENRAWIWASPKIIGGSFVEEGGLQVPFEFSVSNTGKNPGLKVWVMPSFWALTEERVIPWQKHLCEEVRSEHVGLPITAMTIPPGLPLRYHVTLGTPLTEIKPGVRFWLFGCADYRTPGDPRHHQSGFIYEVGRTDPARGSWIAPFDLSHLNNGEGDLTMSPHPQGDGFYAD
jgi:hypothetical protein